MRLFEETQDKIIVTEYLSERDKVLEFKKREIAKIPVDERVLSAERNTNYYSIKTGMDFIGLDELLFKEKNGPTWGYHYHKLECSKLSNEKQKKIIDDYINTVVDVLYDVYKVTVPYDQLSETQKNNFDCFSLIDAKDKEVLKKLKYFLTSESYKIGNNSIASMDGIINSTESMYIYHLLVNDKFKNLINKDIEEEVNLFFPFKKICEIDTKEVIKNDINLKTAGIISNNTETYYDKLMVKVRESEPILKLIKK